MWQYLLFLRSGFHAGVVPQEGDEEPEAQVNMLHRSETSDMEDDMGDNLEDNSHIDALTENLYQERNASSTVEAEISGVEACDDDAVTAFSLDPTFDYDNITLTENPMAKLREDWMKQHMATQQNSTC